MIWLSVLASISFTTMTVAEIEEEKTLALICGLLYIIALFIGAFYEKHQKEKIKKMEKEIKELKKYVKHNTL